MKRCLSTPWCAAAVLLLNLGAARPLWAEARFAITIGNNLGLSEDVPLKWAENDARRIGNVITELGGIKPDRHIRLLNQNVAAITYAFARMRGKVEEAVRQGERTVLLVFFSGHADPQALHIRGEPLPLSTFKELIRSVPSSAAITVVDACNSGSLLRGQRKGLAPSPAFELSYVRDAGPEGTVMIASSGASEAAHESDDLRGAFFTHHLLGGLRGAADANRDGQVTLTEVYRYAYHRTVTTSHGTTATVQHPNLELQLTGEGELVLTFLRRSEATLELDASLEGDILVIADQGDEVAAEVQKKIGGLVTLALPAGRYRVQVRQKHLIRAAPVSLLWAQTHTLNAGALETLPFFAALAKGFSAPTPRWQIRVGVGPETPFLRLDTWAWRSQFSLQRDILNAFPVRLTVGYSEASGLSNLWRIRHQALRFYLSTGLRHHVGPLSLTLFLDEGVIAVRQSLHHRQAARLAAVGLAPPETSADYALAALLGTHLDLTIPLTAQTFLSLEPGIHGVLTKTAHGHRFVRELSTTLSVGYEF